MLAGGEANLVFVRCLGELLSTRIVLGWGRGAGALLGAVDGWEGILRGVGLGNCRCLNGCRWAHGRHVEVGQLGMGPWGVFRRRAAGRDGGARFDGALAFRGGPSFHGWQGGRKIGRNGCQGGCCRWPWCLGRCWWLGWGGRGIFGRGDACREGGLACRGCPSIHGWQGALRRKAICPLAGSILVMGGRKGGSSRAHRGG